MAAKAPPGEGTPYWPIVEVDAAKIDEWLARQGEVGTDIPDQEPLPPVEKFDYPPALPKSPQPFPNVPPGPPSPSGSFAYYGVGGYTQGIPHLIASTWTMVEETFSVSLRHGATVTRVYMLTQADMDRLMGGPPPWAPVTPHLRVQGALQDIIPSPIRSMSIERQSYAYNTTGFGASVQHYAAVPAPYKVTVDF